jgi:hypothetical protein
MRDTEKTALGLLVFVVIVLTASMFYHIGKASTNSDIRKETRTKNYCESLVKRMDLPVRDFDVTYDQEFLYCYINLTLPEDWDYAEDGRGVIVMDLEDLKAVDFFLNRVDHYKEKLVK